MVQIQESLLSQIYDLNRHQFGHKSERHSNPDKLLNPLFSDLFDTEDEVDAAQEHAGPDAADNSKAAESDKKEKKKRKSPTNKTKQAEGNPAVEQVEVISRVPEAERFDADGSPKRFIGYDNARYWHLIPLQIVCLTVRREIWASKKNIPGEIMTAPVPPHVLPKAGVTPALFADTIVNKLHGRQPWYHQSNNLQQQYGITITRGTMAKWTIKGAEALKPYFERLKCALLGYDVLGHDATWFNVLKSKHGPGKRACIWSHYGGPPGMEVALFSYQGDLAKQEYLSKWYGKYDGTALGDGDLDYGRVQSDIGWKIACCNSHARRRFEKITRKTKSRGLAHDFMDLYSVIYEKEAEALEQNLSVEAHTIWRQQKLKPFFDRFHEILKKEMPNVPLDSDLGNAMSYCLNRWKELTLCLDDARIPLDTNHVERIIRKFVLGRNNFLFADSPSGADALCIFYSLLQTARIHGLDERKFLEHLFKKIPLIDIKDHDALDSLLPWNLDRKSLNNTQVCPTGWDFSD